MNGAVVMTMAELLPMSFGPNDLARNPEKVSQSPFRPGVPEAGKLVALRSYLPQLRRCIALGDLMPVRWVHLE